MQLLMVAAGGALGALCRYGLSSWLQRRGPGAFPLGTLAVNVLGCLAIGALMALFLDRPGLDARLRGLLVVGFLGSFTTFSAFGYETVELARHGAVAGALASVALNVVLGIAAVLAGRLLVRELWG